MPPALPARRRVSHPPIPNQSTSSDISISPPKLYPSLEQELSALTLESVSYPLKPASQPRPKFIPTPSEMTTRWQSAQTETTTGGEQSTGLPTACNHKISEDKVPQKSKAQSKHNRINLIQCRKIFKKKKNHLEEHTYMEINEAKVTTEPAALQIAANTDHQEVDGVSGTLPLEYLNPPPFAPGY
ncbi:hypothetical protein PDJAM_G00026420 [Pangasius djambal]|uniref:Uncharacterized protein n=1 Tax=Pangasius djambal TaxID=1691987 RepID=A0ACC5YPT0_9TELE|nr:hypothetical protein [Pangasius djambal]